MSKTCRELFQKDNIPLYLPSNNTIKGVYETFDDCNLNCDCISTESGIITISGQFDGSGSIYIKCNQMYYSHGGNQFPFTFFVDGQQIFDSKKCTNIYGDCSEIYNLCLNGLDSIYQQCADAQNSCLSLCGEEDWDCYSNCYNNYWMCTGPYESACYDEYNNCVNNTTNCESTIDYSLNYTFSNKGIPKKDTTVSVSKQAGRGDVVIAQQPSSNNNYELIVTYNDDPQLGDDYYNFTINW